MRRCELRRSIVCEVCVCAARPLPVANTAHEAQSFPPLEDKENVKARRCCMQQNVLRLFHYCCFYMYNSRHRQQQAITCALTIAIHIFFTSTHGKEVNQFFRAPASVCFQKSDSFDFLQTHVVTRTLQPPWQNAIDWVDAGIQHDGLYG